MIFGHVFGYQDYLIEGQLQSKNVPVLAVQCQGIGILSLSAKEICIAAQEFEKIQLLRPEAPVVTGCCQPEGLVSTL